MLNKSHIVTALFALTVMNNIRTKIEARKAADIYLKAYKAFGEIDTARGNQIEYLCNMLAENDIVIDEFDMIMLYNQ